MIVFLAAALSCVAIDGDTIRCGRRHIRLVAIDAPEMPGHCRTGRDCAPGDPFTSKAAMEAALAGGKVTVVRRGPLDRYGRTVADVRVNGVSLSCKQIAGGFARYWPRYDPGKRVAKECGLP